MDAENLKRELLLPEPEISTEKTFPTSRTTFPSRYEPKHLSKFLVPILTRLLPSNSAVSAKKYWLSLLALTAALLVLGYQFRLQSNAWSTDFTLYYTLLKQISLDVRSLNTNH